MNHIMIKCVTAIACIGLCSSALAQEKGNPFTGTTASFEQRLRVLEERKIDSAIAGEELAKEKADQERLRLKNGGSTPAAVIQTTIGPAPKGKAAAPRAEVEPVAPAPPPPKAPRLVGTVSTAAGWVALVEKGSAIVNVPEHSTIDGINVGAVSQYGATLNGVHVALEATAGRVASAAIAQVLAVAATGSSADRNWPLAA